MPLSRRNLLRNIRAGAIFAAAMTSTKPGKKLVKPAPPSPARGKRAQTAGIEVAAAPLKKPYGPALPAMLDRVSSSTGLVYIVNPNNPTGTLTPRKDREAFIAKLPAGVPVLIDEAYHHFVAPAADYQSFLDRPIGDPRVIVARTFSNIFRLARIR